MQTYYRLGDQVLYGEVTVVTNSHGEKRYFVGDTEIFPNELHKTYAEAAIAALDWLRRQHRRVCDELHLLEKHFKTKVMH